VTNIYEIPIPTLRSVKGIWKKDKNSEIAIEGIISFW